MVMNMYVNLRNSKLWLRILRAIVDKNHLRSVNCHFIHRLCDKLDEVQKRAGEIVDLVPCAQ